MGARQKWFNSTRGTEDARNAVQVPSLPRGALEGEDGRVTRDDRALIGPNRDCSNTKGRGDCLGKAVVWRSYRMTGLISVQTV